MTIDFGLALPAGPPKGQVNKWLDDLDASLPHLEGHFKSLWVTDHFFWEDDPTYEVWTALAFAAARWPQFDLGPMVLGQSYRNPALVAKMGATLQALSGGRFIMAVGAGWKEDEYHAYGYPYPRAGIRIAQLEDTLEIITRMWTTPGKVTYRGQHYSVIDAYCEPKPDPVPPIIVGGGGTKTTLLAARFADWWNLHDANYTDYSGRLRVLMQHCADDIGRDPATLRFTWFGRLAVNKTEEGAYALGRGQFTPKNAFVGTPQQVVEQMTPFVDAGVDYFMVEVLGLPAPDVIGMVLEDVLPKLQ
jgi:alkanesulfonate monooxygenase SsuD/methylene tetrahydromethanopterin reductase-like flavin-dependent oxidoreductase (luciferase family)